MNYIINNLMTAYSSHLMSIDEVVDDLIENDEDVLGCRVELRDPFGRIIENRVLVPGRGWVEVR